MGVLDSTPVLCRSAMEEQALAKGRRDMTGAELAGSPGFKAIMRCCVLLSLMLAAGACVAQEGDPLQSLDCRRALEALQAQEAALPRVASEAARREALARLEPARQRVARACLQSRTDPAPSGRLAQPPVSVPPAAAVPAPAAPPLRAPPTVNLPAPAAPPPVVTSCDAAGCWASDGTRLNRAGPNLLGPRGVCTVSGTMLHCP